MEQWYREQIKELVPGLAEVLESALSISSSNFGQVRAQVSRTLEEFYGGLRINGN
jgi:hypothetical protein